MPGLLPWFSLTVGTGRIVPCAIDAHSGWAIAPQLPEHFLVLASVDVVISLVGVTSCADSAFPGKFGKPGRFRRGAVICVHDGGKTR